MARILLTGSTGFLGGCAYNRLMQRHEVVRLTRGKPAGDDELGCDLADPGRLAAELEELDVAAVVHCAAAVNLADADPAAFFAVNTLATALLAHHCARSGAKLVYASSISVHGGGEETVGHGLPLAPDTAYGMSKLGGERNVQLSGCRHAIVRFAGIFGAGGPTHLGLNRRLAAAPNGRRATLDVPGNGRRNYVYVKDAARHLERCLDDPLDGIFYSAGEEQTIREMVSIINEIAFGDAPLPEVPSDEPERSQVVERSQVFGPPTPFRDAVRDFI